MTASAREDAPTAPSARLMRGPVDEGVSPVVGMILVLGISVVGIAGILYWGLPAIDEMKATVEFRSVQSQFLELDGTVKELVAGTTERTAKRWLPSLNRGELHVQNATEPWLYATEPYNSSADHDFTYSAFSDGDHGFSIHSQGTGELSWWRVEAYIVTGTSTLTPINVSIDNTDNQVQATFLDKWTSGQTKTFTAWVKDAQSPGVAVPLRNATFKIKIYSGASVVGEAWYVTTGRIDYQLHAGVGDKRIVQNNGAVLVGDGTSMTLLNAPPLPAPTTTNGIPRFFGRAVVLSGNTSFVGEDRFDLLVSLNSTATLASYDCALATRADCVETVKIYNFGDQRDAWYQYLTNTGRGYTYTIEGTAPNQHLEMRESYMGYTLLQSVLRVTAG